MKLIKKFAAAFAAFMAFITLAACIPACDIFGGGDDDNRETTQPIEDKYGYIRPADCWITQGLLLSGENYALYKDELFGDGGNSGLLNKELAALDGENLGEGDCDYFVYMIFANGVSQKRSVLDCYLDFFIRTTDGGYTSGGNCFEEEIKPVYDSSAINLSLNMGQAAAKRLSVSLRNQSEVVQTVIAFPLKIKTAGTFYADVRVNDITLSANANSYSDGIHGAAVKKDADCVVAVDNLKIRFASGSGLTIGDISDNTLKDYADFSDGGCYMVTDFSFTTMTDNDGDAKFYADVRVSENEVVSVSLEDVPSGNASESSAGGKYKLIAPFIVPDIEGDGNNVRIILYLSSEEDFIAEAEVYLYCDGALVTGETYSYKKLTRGNPTFKFEKSGAEYYLTGVWNKTIKNADLTSGVGGKKITRIYNTAFAGTALKTIKIGKDVTYIDNNAFGGCNALESITVDSENTKYLTANGILYNKPVTQFMCVPNMLSGSVTVPSGITKVAGDLFKGNEQITSITLPNSVKRIETSAFSGCKKLEALNLGSGVMHIGSGIVSGTPLYENSKKDKCLYLNNCLIYSETGNVSSGTRVIAQYAFSNDVSSISLPNSIVSCGLSMSNTQYYRNEKNWTGGALYVGKCLVAVNNYTNFTVKSGTIVIGDNAFGYQSSGTAEIRLPDSVKTIGDSAFYSGSYNIVIGTGVTHIGTGNSGMYYYLGTEEQWAKIDCESRISEYQLYFYSKNKPAQSGYYWHYVNDKITKW